MLFKNILIIDILIVLLFMLILKLIDENNKKSIYNLSFATRIYAVYIFPVILFIINLIIGILYKPDLYYIIIVYPLITPFIAILIEMIIENKNKRLYVKYSDKITSIVEDSLKQLDMNICDKDIKIFFDQQKDKVYCKVIIYTESIDILMLKNLVKNKVKAQIPFINIDILIRRVHLK